MRQTSTFGALFIGQWAGTFGGKRAGERPHRLVPARAIRHYLLTALPGLTISYLGFRRKTAFRQKTVVNYKTQRGRQIWAITAKFRLFFFFLSRPINMGRGGFLGVSASFRPHNGLWLL